MAAGVAMVMMAVIVHMFVSMLPGLMAVLMAIVGMGHGLMLMLMLMFVFAVAAHILSPPSRHLLKNNAWAEKSQWQVGRR